MSFLIEEEKKEKIEDNVLCPECNEKAVEIKKWQKWEDPCTYFDFYEAKCKNCPFVIQKKDSIPELSKK